MAVRKTAVSETAPDLADGPVRTCIGCRRRSSAAELLRVVAAPAGTSIDSSPSTPRGESGAVSVVLPDPHRRAGGRGAWLHPDLACVEQAKRRRAFTRALHHPGELDSAPVFAYLASTHGTSTSKTY